MRVILAVAVCLSSIPAQAAVLRPYTELATGTVHLGDLFDGLGNTPDRVLGRAPAPGEKITVEAPQLAAIARDFGVDWRPQSGSERSVLQRPGQAISASLVTFCLLTALRAAGAPADGDVFMPTFTPPMIGAGATPKLDASQVSYDLQSGRFTALVTIHDGQDDVPSLRLSGQIVSMRDAATLTHRLAIGAVLTSEDVVPLRVRSSLLQGVNPLLPSALIGMALKHEVSPGQPLTQGDVMRPVMVARGSTVRMRLDTAGIALTAMGIALESGGIGENIRVQNPSSHAVVIGEVTGQNTVRVAPGTAPQLSLATAQ
jgi:flagella basal body P-ring formation protein FlgA